MGGRRVLSAGSTHTAAWSTQLPGQAPAVGCWRPWQIAEIALMHTLIRSQMGWEQLSAHAASVCMPCRLPAWTLSLSQLHLSF